MAPTRLPTKTHITDRPTSNQTDTPTKKPVTPAPTHQSNEFPITDRPTNQPTSEPSNETTPLTDTVNKISFVAFGDIPYTKDQRYCLNKQLRQLDQEQMGFKFMAHVGDIKWGKTLCYESSFSDISEIFTHPSNALNYDARDCFFVPGDNEFQDCQDVDQAWRWWMQYFGNGNITKTGIGSNENGFGTLSDPDISVDYQSLRLENGFYPTSAGNFAFFTDDVLFMGIHQVGGGTVGDESTRVHRNYQWVEQNMARRHAEGMRFAHASIRSKRRQYFGNPFMRLLREKYPDISVLYIHGDGHNFHTYQPDTKNPNLACLEVDGGEEADPLLISVVHDTAADKIGFDIDIRGGYYYSGCQTGNTDKTWSS
eukprot:CAMPEP_0181138278 /NCGR_PEP_ID=MMETSP1071-20121207/34160_1 /TAXON_ID=35127 /ORGANISM="Thalassiosira sp., Strain NH16" /LENGTH=367 /DNA_ID=CAMNT_0023225101 /DNA_START=46 /DNA_END=1145 /DNA_ORIENTATION=-